MQWCGDAQKNRGPVISLEQSRGFLRVGLGLYIHHRDFVFHPSHRHVSYGARLLWMLLVCWIRWEAIVLRVHGARNDVCSVSVLVKHHLSLGEVSLFSCSAEV